MLVMPPVPAHQPAHEAEEDPTLNESTTGIRIVPLPAEQDVFTEVLRDGARRMLERAIEAEAAAWIEARAHLEDEAGPKQVLRDGHRPERTIQTGLGPIEIQPPRVQDRRPTGRREAFTSAILPRSPPPENPPNITLDHTPRCFF
jgi:putative transposase